MHDHYRDDCQGCQRVGHYCGANDADNGYDQIGDMLRKEKREQEVRSRLLSVSVAVSIISLSVSVASLYLLLKLVTLLGAAID